MKRDTEVMLSPEQEQARAAFFRLDQGGQIATLRGTRVARTFQIDRAAGIDEEARTAWMSIASEEPYERWWGIEILDMGKQSIRDQRLKMGAPLLVGHDTSDQVGVVEDFEVTSGRKLRVLARFGRSARAEEIWRDVLDGIRRNTSVGYVIHDLVLEKSEEGANTYRVTDWEPLEGSLVPVPADPTVGLGRTMVQTNFNQERSHSMTPEEKAKMEAEIRAKVEAELREKAAAEARAAEDARGAGEALKREQQRVSEILACGDLFKDEGGPELARKLITEPDATMETFKARMFESQRGRQKPLATAQAGEIPASYGEGARVRFRYGKLRAYTKPLVLSNGQKMEAEEAAYRAGMWMAGALYQKDWALRWLRENGVDLYQQLDNGQVRVMSGATLGAGGALVPVEMEQSIIDLRDDYGVARQLLRVRPMASDVKTIPRRSGGVTAYFFTDDDGVGISASDKSWNNVTLSAKKLGALCRVSEDLEEDAIIDVVDDLTMEIAYAFAVKEDQCFLIGDGTSTYGGMNGLVTKFETTAYASRSQLAANHDTFPEVDATDLAQVMGAVSKFGTAGAKWLCSNTAKALMFDRLKASAGGNDVISLAQGVVPAYLGYEIVTSEVMPAGPSTDYSSKVMFFFGRYDLAGSMGNRRGITLQVLRERYAELGQIGIKGTERFDIVNHDLGDTTNKGPVSAGYGN